MAHELSLNCYLNQLYIKAYELFKKYNPGDISGHGQGRLIFWIAYRIAQTHCDSGQYEMAIRFVLIAYKVNTCSTRLPGSLKE